MGRRILYGMEDSEVLEDNIGDVVTDCLPGETVEVCEYKRKKVDSSCAVASAVDSMRDSLVDEYGDMDGELLDEVSVDEEIASMIKKIDAGLRSWQCEHTGRSFQVVVTENGYNVSEYTGKDKVKEGSDGKTN